MRQAILIEKATSNYSAYVPDLPGCVATGVTLQEIEEQIKEAIAFHLEGLREEGLPIPEPSSLCQYVEAQMCFKLAIAFMQKSYVPKVIGQGHGNRNTSDYRTTFLMPCPYSSDNPT